MVFVHGFTGCPIRTWTHNTATVPLDEIENPPSKIRKVLARSFGSDERTTASRKVYWPLDLLPDTLPDGRVLTYGYDTHVRHVAAGPVSDMTLHAHAGDFLAALESERRQGPSRPLLFVAHSLGGLLVKEALRQSRGHESQLDFRTIFESTIGIVFFGTPHEGAGPRASVRHAVTLLAKGLGFRLNDKIVNALVPSAEHQLQLRDEFNRMIDDGGWIIHSFQEQYALPGLFQKKVCTASTRDLHSAPNTHPQTGRRGQFIVREASPRRDHGTHSQRPQGYVPFLRPARYGIPQGRIGSAAYRRDRGATSQPQPRSAEPRVRAQSCTRRRCLRGAFQDTSVVPSLSRD